MRTYATDLTEAQWALVHSIIPEGKTIIADADHQSRKLRRLIKAEGYELRIVKRHKQAFEVVGLTWIVERTFAWIGTVPSHEQGLRAPCAGF